MPTCFLVLGAPRSGTSAVAGVLHHLGVRMGEKIGGPEEPDRWDFPDANEWNPRGSFQDARLGNLEDAEFGAWGVPGGGWVPSGRFLGGLRALAAARSARGGDWGLKSNRLPFYLGRFREAWGGEVRAVSLRRDPARSLASLRARGGPPEGEALIVALAGLLPAEGSLVLDYDALHDDPEGAVALLAGFAGRQVTAAALAHLDPGLRRF